jgi:pseudouridine-5'-phosphate glycosidase/pseudouridine kinase
MQYISIINIITNVDKGKSLDANVSLILNNAKVASNIALEYNNLTKSNNNITNNHINNNIDYNNKHNEVNGKRTAADVVVVGGAVADFISKIETKSLLGSSNPGSMTSSYGGVGRNVAQCLGLYHHHHYCYQFYLYFILMMIRY